MRIKLFEKGVMKHRSKADDRILQRKKEDLHNQLQEAVDYCLQNDCKGYKALKSGLFPLIRDAQTINRRLLKKGDFKRIEIGEERKHLRIITVNEEKKLVAHIKNSNRFDMICWLIRFFISLH